MKRLWIVIDVPDEEADIVLDRIEGEQNADRTAYFWRRFLRRFRRSSLKEMG